MSLLSQASLVMTPNAIKESKIYSIIPTNGNGDADFTRGTLASSTLNNVSGLIETVPYNLLNFSEQFDQSYWNKTRCTITPNSTNSPNGTLTADTLVGNSIAGENYVYVPQNATIGVPNVLSVYIKPIDITLVKLVSFTQAGQARFSLIGSGSVTFEIGTCTNSTIESLPNGWYRISTKITPTATAINNIGISTSTLGIVGNCFYLWGAQLVQGSIPKDYFFTTDRLNVPRLNYDVAGGCPSLLLEPQRTNLLLNSVWAGGGTIPTSWAANFATGTSTPIASIKNPNVTAYTFVTTSTQRQEFSQQFTFSSTPTNSITCFSVYVESVTTAVTVYQLIRVNPIGAGAGTTVFLKNNVVIASGTNIEAGNTYSIQYTVTTSATFQFRVGSGVNNAVAGNFVLSMPQVEQGLFPTTAYSTSFIPTTTGSVTRNGDVLKRNNIYTNGLITSAGGTWFVELNNNISLIRDDTSAGLTIDSSASYFNNGFLIRNNFSGLTARLGIQIRTGGVVVGSSYNTLTETVKIAIKWDGVNANVYVNGAIRLTNVPFTTKIMENLAGFAQDVPRYIKSMYLFPTPLTDTECISLTQ